MIHVSTKELEESFCLEKRQKMHQLKAVLLEIYYKGTIRQQVSDLSQERVSELVQCFNEPLRINSGGNSHWMPDFYQPKQETNNLFK